MKVIIKKSSYINGKHGSISMSYNEWKDFEKNNICFIVINEKTNKPVKMLQFKDVTGNIFLYRYKEAFNSDFKHTPDKNVAEKGIIHAKFMVCNF